MVTVDSFSAARMNGAQDKRFQDKYNYLVNLLTNRVTGNRELAHNELITSSTTILQTIQDGSAWGAM